MKNKMIKLISIGAISLCLLTGCNNDINSTVSEYAFDPTSEGCQEFYALLYEGFEAEYSEVPVDAFIPILSEEEFNDIISASNNKEEWKDAKEEYDSILYFQDKAYVLEEYNNYIRDLLANESSTLKRHNFNKEHCDAVFKKPYSVVYDEAYDAYYQLSVKAKEIVGPFGGSDENNLYYNFKNDRWFSFCFGDILE